MARLDWQAQVAQLRRERPTNVSDLVWRAADLLIEAISEHGAGGVITTRRWLLEASRDIIAAQPAVGPLFSLVNGMLWAVQDATSAGAIRQTASEYLVAYQAGWEEANARLVAQAVEALAPTSAAPPYRRLLVYAADATVQRVLMALAAGEAPPEILCSEGRPGYEGLAMASELVAAGLKVTIGIDMALLGWLGRADALVLGCSSLSRNGLVAQLGAASLAQAAREREMPVIVICRSSKLLPDDYVIDTSGVVGDPAQIMPPEAENLTVSNALLDTTPLDAVTAVVTEESVLAGEQLLGALRDIRIYPGLRGG